MDLPPTLHPQTDLPAKPLFALDLSFGRAAAHLPFPASTKASGRARL